MWNNFAAQFFLGLMQSVIAPSDHFNMSVVLNFSVISAKAIGEPIDYQISGERRVYWKFKPLYDKKRST